MQNVVINMREKFHNDRSRNDGALGDRKSDNTKKNNNKNNVRSALGPVSGSNDNNNLIIITSNVPARPYFYSPGGAMSAKSHVFANN